MQIPPMPHLFERGDFPNEDATREEHDAIYAHRCADGTQI